MVRRIKEFLRIAFSPRYLLLTNTVTCVSLLGIADVSQQMYGGAYLRLNKEQMAKGGNHLVDWSRTRRVATVGFLTGPMNTFWYRWLEQAIRGPKTASLVAKKVGVDLLSSPVFDCTFVMTVAVQEGKSLSEGWNEYRCKFHRIIMCSFMVWIPTQSINFSLIPPRFRVLFVVCVYYVYNCLLTYIKHDHCDPKN